MVAGAAQPKWDILEAVILLDGYLAMLNGKQNRQQTIKDVSMQLRKMANNRGQTIDDAFRNESGISYQLQSMQSAYSGMTMSVPATVLFNRTVELYHVDQECFTLLLDGAKEIISGEKGKKENYLFWLSDQLPQEQLISVLRCYPKIEKICLKTRVIRNSLFDISDLSIIKKVQRAVSNNIFFLLVSEKLRRDYSAAMQYYALYLEENQRQTDYPSDPVSLAELPVKTGEDKQIGNGMVGIAKILQTHYQYGFKYESIRELMRFRQFAEIENIVLPENTEQLKVEIIAAGTIIGDKVYCNGEDMSNWLQSIVNEAFDTGAEVIYYERLLELHAEKMAFYKITSEEMLKEYLKKHIPDCSFSRRFMARGAKRTEKDAVTDEIRRVWGDEQTANVDALAERLPFIPLSNIWRVISGNELFVLSNEGEYLLIDRFYLTDEDAERIVCFVESACTTNGFASLSDIPLGKIADDNYELSKQAIVFAIYKKALSNRFNLNGKIITKDAAELDAVILLKQYIADKDECTFDEVAEKVVELTGSVNRQYAFLALYDEMVRIDRNKFVANRLVDFDVAEIDAALSQFVNSQFCAIRDVTTFAMFPMCGQNWNHYLLESYCYKYSEKFGLFVSNFNDKNAGIIAERAPNTTYNDYLILALARANIELQAEIAGQYLFDNGYTAKRKYKNLDELVEKARNVAKEK